MKKIVLAFGRMNPPTVGHEKLVQKINSVARKEKATPALYLSHSQDKKKNPLSYDDKVKYATKAFGRIVKKTTARTIIEVLKELDSQYDEVIVVGGSDRVDEFKTLLTKYNGKDYAFEKLDVVSAGERDPDADDVSGMSASKLRELAVTGKVKEFRAGLPARLRQSRDGAQMYNKIREAMGITEDMTLDEVLSVQQRLKKRAVMRRMKNKIKLGRRRAKFKFANKAKLQVRSQRKAREMLRGRLAGALGKNYKKLNPGARIQIDKKLEKKKALIARLAKRLMPKVKKAEMERLKKARQTKKESIEYLYVVNDMLNEIAFESITDKVEKNLQKKSEKYGVTLEELKMKYLSYKEFMSENETFDTINTELANEAMSPESQKAHRGMFKAAQKKKDDAAAQRDRLARLKKKGWVKNDRGGMTKITEDDKPNKRGDDAKGHKRPTEDGAGLTRKGAKAAGVKTAVTTPPSKLDPNGKAAKRRKSFCARMSGMKGPMKDEKGRPTRKAMSLRRWNCNEDSMLETVYQKRAKDRIEREKAADMAKHDRAMDRARLRDARAKNIATKPTREETQIDEISAKTAKSAWLKRKAQAAKVSGHNHDILAAKARKNKERFGHKEELPEAKSAQDPDIKDRKGTQPAAYHKGLKKSTKAKRDAHFKKHGPKADNDASAYKDAPGDKEARKKGMQKSKYTKFVDQMMDEESKGLAAKAKKSGISVGTLRKVYNRGVAAWKTGHRPGTTPQQWGHARVNAFITKKKKGGLNHDKDLA